MVYGMAWQAWHGIWYGLAGMACYTVWYGLVGMVWCMVQPGGPCIVHNMALGQHMVLWYGLVGLAWDLVWHCGHHME